MSKYQKLLDKALCNLPEGVAVYFVRGRADIEQGISPDTVCLLIKSEGKNNHRLPCTFDKWEILASGICFFNVNDDWDSPDWDKAELISLGRALKAYSKNNAVMCRGGLSLVGYATGNTVNGAPAYITIRGTATK